MVNWDQFRVCNSNPRIDFENLCRMLFRHLYLSPGTELMMAPNNPGVEVEPVWDRNNEKRISYQSKFFDNTPDYQQILHSVEETIKYYAGKIDRVYLYCNKKLTPTAKTYVKAKGVLQANSIELIPVCDDEILDQVREDSLAEHTYFEQLPDNNTTVFIANQQVAFYRNTDNATLTASWLVENTSYFITGSICMDEITTIIESMMK